jgi:preprotein translocase subunit SecE
VEGVTQAPVNSRDVFLRFDMKRWRWVQAISEFLSEVKAEMFKVSYPTKSEVIGSTTVVILLTIIVSLFLSLMDAALVRLLRWVV